MAEDVDDVLEKLVIYHLSAEEQKEAEAEWAHEGYPVGNEPSRYAISNPTALAIQNTSYPFRHSSASAGAFRPMKG
ncbi:hypothetical protein ELI45_31105 (plasmid) [Rhizobium ruizarguesonis]|uniref:hypothetical protein n=1 Tax=Rhizobium TaxID=379 RepID=UPI0009B7CD32|nr:hypothetical protein [Rhizobium leguminosarum]TAU59875.1 hypothetical protein ELI45_31105 [Rhizobium ruizarguesonis]